MLFPWTADSGAYQAFGQNCAKAFSAGDFFTCYNGLRPIGILSYYALPFWAATDPVTVAYITLLMNLMCLLVLVYSCWVLLRSNVSTASAPQILGERVGVARRIFFATFLAVMLIQTVGYLPLRLADIQSLCLLMLGAAIVVSPGLVVPKRTAFLGGLIAGLSVLFRQNYVLALAFIVALWFLYALRFRSRAMLITAFWFGVGAGSCMIQLVWVYLHTGIPWFYEPQALAFYAESTAQPYVELVAYSLPSEGAYAAHLIRPVSEWTFLATKIYHGLFKFYWTPSLGVAPLEYTAQALDYSDGDFLMFQTITVMLGVVALASIFLRRPWLSILVISAFGSAVAGAYMSQVEYRYFLFPRLAYIIYAFVLVWIVFGYAAKKLRLRQGMEGANRASVR